MNRREIVTAFGALAVVPVLGSIASAQEPIPMTADRQEPGESASNHMTQTAAIGSLSLLASRLAESRIQNPKVAQFIKFEIAEQNTVSDVIVSMSQPASQSSGMVHPPTDAQAMSHLTPDGHAALEKLRGLSGKDFERAYLHAEVDGHEKLLAIQESYLAIGHDREELSFAKLAKGVIKEHLALLKDLGAS
jgi:putative membrane protein